MTGRPVLHWRRERITLATTLRTGRSIEDGADVLTTRLTLDGIEGWGEISPQEHYGETTQDAERFLDAWSLPDAADLLRPDLVSEALHAAEAPLCVRSGLVAATYDLLGRHRGMPVFELLELDRVERPATTVTITLDTADRMASTAQTTRPDIQRLKLKLGGDGHDLERVRAVRHTTDRQLAVDANGTWSHEEALRLIPELAGLGVVLVEQPLAPGHPAAQSLSHATPLPIFLDEECHSVEDLGRCRSVADGVNVKLSKCGGIVDALAMIRSARKLGLGIMIGCEVESSLGIAASVAISGLADHADLDSALLLSHDPWTGLRLINGVIQPASLPGFGLIRADHRNAQ